MGLLFRDLNVLSAPNNSTNFTSVTTTQRGPERGDDRHSRGRKHHRHHQDHGHKSKKRHCH